MRALGTPWLWMPVMLALAGCERQTPPAQVGTATPAPAATQVAAAPLLCPVTGQPIDRQFTAPFRGRWVYFANQAAQDEFARDPYRFADAVKAQWNADEPLRVQVKCPVTGAPPNVDIYVGRGLDAVYFATEDAKTKYAADPASYAARLADCYTYQTRCAHSGMNIDPQVTLDFKGRTLYFFCENCRAAFEQEPPAEQAHLLQLVDAQIAAHAAAWERRARP